MLTATALIVMAFALVLARRVWPHRLNPVVIGVLVWTPGLLLATIPREFVSPVYAHLNHELGWQAAAALLLGAVYFSAGALVVLAFTTRQGWDSRLSQHKVEVDDRKVVLLYTLGLIVFLYSYARSGLGDVVSLDPEAVAESRLKLHLGPISFAVLFLDISAVIFMAKLLESRRLIYALPVAVAILCQMATLQKSRMLFLALAAIFLMLQNPQAAREIVLGSAKRKLTAGLATVLLIASLFVMNALRGIGVVQMTEFNSPLFEQVYIYSGATAVLDLSSALQGLVPSDPPTLGLVLARPITWHLVDRELLNPTRHFEGINAASYLIYPWSDFRWIGFVITPFLTGLISTWYLWLSLRKTVVGLILGTIGFQAVVFSINTDVIFDPTTLILIILALVANVLVTKRSGRASRIDSQPSSGAGHAIL